MLSLALVLVSLAQAEEQRTPSWRPVGDSAWLGGAIAVGAATELGKDGLVRDEGWYPSNAAFDPAWDEAYWAKAKRLRKTSDALMYGSMLAATLAPAAYGRGQLKDVGVMAQTISTTLAVTNIFKIAIGEERPYTRLDPAAMQTYDPGLYEDVVVSEDPLTYSADSRMSMPSGHTSLFAASAFGTVTTLAWMYADPVDTWGGADWALWGGGYALATAGTVYVASLRYRGGKHHIRDTAFGGAIGLALGVAVPSLHFVSGWVPEVSGDSETLRIGWSGTF
ncbi:MAG: phosphatase PAP2 family protein [Alphaproteobacteria bacterium]|nr:phosphatase PAP2 family protein [Alphaproteobacteria bacterium]